MIVRSSRLLKLLLKSTGRLGVGPTPASVKFGNVGITPYLNDACAAASISADFELAWAWREWGIERAEKMGLMERKNIPLILRLLDELHVPITFATVGHLFLESCGSKQGRLHGDMPRPPFNRRWRGDWYQHDPGGTLCTHPAWYCPDLIRSIQHAKSRHEIGCHTFSHIEFSSECSNEDLVTAELRQCQEAMWSFGTKLRTLVYPFNIMGHQYLRLLSELGVVAVRHRDSDLLLAYPERDSSGVFKIYETMGLRESKYFPQTAKALILLEEAVSRGLCYHLWFHPSDPAERLQTTFREILEGMLQLQARGDLWITTMGGLAAYCEARRTTTIDTQWNGEALTLRFRSTYDCVKYGSTELTVQVPYPKKAVQVRLIGQGTTLFLAKEKIGYCDDSRALILNVPCDKQSFTLSIEPLHKQALESAYVRSLSPHADTISN